MKTFDDLIQEVIDPGLCHRCGACVAFCSSINYGALELDSEGKPGYADKDKCIEGGLCYLICPEIEELNEETRQLAGWTAPIGRVADISIARSTDSAIRHSATDGGVVTALLVHLLRKGQIDSAVVAKQVAPYQRRSFLAATEEEIRSAAGFSFDAACGIKSVSDHYSNFYRVGDFNPLNNQGFRRVAFVGTPCQIQALRKMQTLNIYPSDAVKYCLGLFCSGSFICGEKEREKIAQIGCFQWEQVYRVNIKENLIIHLKSGEALTIRLSDLKFMKRRACNFCVDYSSEYADISFGGLGAEEGWTTVIVRSPLGASIFSEAKYRAIEESRQTGHPPLPVQALNKIKVWSNQKRGSAFENRKKLRMSSPSLKRIDCPQ
jgi:coenzyme F420 hydrogenase subunit beta